MGIFDKAKDFADKNPDKADQAIDRLGDEADRRTGNKHEQHVDRAQDMARDRLNPPQQ